MSDDATLARRAAGGDSAAFAALYDRHAEAVHRFCLRTLGGREDAADAVQDAFLGLLRRLQAEGEPVERPGAYLFTAARHACLRIIERGGRVVPVEETPEEASMSGPSEPEVGPLVEGQRADVRAANGRLPLGDA